MLPQLAINIIDIYMYIVIDLFYNFKACVWILSVRNSVYVDTTHVFNCILK